MRMRDVLLVPRHFQSAYRHFSLIPTAQATRFLPLMLDCGGERSPACFCATGTACGLWVAACQLPLPWAAGLIFQALKGYNHTAERTWWGSARSVRNSLLISRRNEDKIPGVAHA